MSWLIAEPVGYKSDGVSEAVAAAAFFFQGREELMNKLCLFSQATTWILPNEPLSS